MSSANPKDVLRNAANAARLGQVFFRRHAERRMDERGATADDVMRALETATTATWQPDHETWRMEGGRDLDGDELTVAILTPTRGVVVVTVF